jgi:ParB-like chromosome segregation protein Spo0J
MMDDLEIAWRPLGELIPYARNPRTHSDAQVAQIAASIREFGWTNPVLVDGENGIIAGHGRVLAARKLGWDRVPVIEFAHMSEAQKRAYVLADNQLALNAGWDEALLRLELTDLSGLGFDMRLIGFGDGELERLLAGEGQVGLTEDDEGRRCRTMRSRSRAICGCWMSTGSCAVTRPCSPTSSVCSAGSSPT